MKILLLSCLAQRAFVGLINVKMNREILLYQFLNLMEAFLQYILYYVIIFSIPKIFFYLLGTV